jgi:hypothetical protein
MWLTAALDVGLRIGSVAVRGIDDEEGPSLVR